VVADQRPAVSPQDHCRPLAYCASTPGRPIPVRTADHSEHQLIDTSCKAIIVALMLKAVQFDSYGGVDVLEVRDVPRPVPEAGEVLVEVRAAGINPSAAVIRSGALADQYTGSR
jgi:hypothetical protein